MKYLLFVISPNRQCNFTQCGDGNLQSKSSKTDILGLKMCTKHKTFKSRMKACAKSEDVKASEQTHVKAWLPKLYIWSDLMHQWLGISPTRNMC